MPSAPWMLIPILTLNLLVTMGWAQDEHLAAEVVEVVTGQLEDLELAQVPGELGDEQQALVARNPRQAHRLCETLAEQAVAMVRHDAEATDAVLELVGQVVARLEDRGSREVLATRAEYRLAGARLERERGDQEAAAAGFHQAATGLYEAHRQDPGRRQDRGKLLVRALDLLVERCHLEGVDRVETCALGEGWAKAALEKYDDLPELERSSARLDLVHTEALYRDARGQARKLLQRAFETLEPRLAGSSTPLPIATVHNDAVRLGASLKLGGSGDYLTRTTTFCEDQVAIDLPLSTFWEEDTEVQVPEVAYVDDKGKPAEEDCHALDLVERDWQGQERQRLRIMQYSWKYWYKFGGEKAGGNNLKGLAAACFSSVQSELRKVTGRRKPSGKRFSRHLKDTLGLEVTGVTRDGREVITRVYLWRSQDLEISVAVTLWDYTGERRLDPLMEAVIGTLRPAQ